jgi:hypothetical protein
MSNDFNELLTGISHHLSGQEELCTPPHQFHTHITPRAEYHPNLGHSSLPVQHSFSWTLPGFRYAFLKKNESIRAEDAIGTDASQKNGGYGRFMNPCNLAQAFHQTPVTNAYIFGLDRISLEWSIRVDEKRPRWHSTNRSNHNSTSQYAWQQAPPPQT